MSTEHTTNQPHGTLDPIVRNLREQSAGCRLSFSWFGTRKTLTTDQKASAAEVFDADGRALSASKRLIDTKNPMWKALIAIRGEMRDYWTGNTLPYPEAGTRLIRRQAISLFQTHMEQGRERLAAAVDSLEGEYSAIQEHARATLGSLFNPSDYPPTLRGLFSVEWDFPNLTPPDYLRDLSPNLYEEEQSRISARFADAVKLAEEAFAAEFATMTSHLASVLTDGPDGKKTFRDSAVTNLREFFDRFRTLSVRSNSDLDALIDQAQAVIAGTSPKELRGNQNLRVVIAQDMARIAQQIEAQVITAPTRRIRLPGVRQQDNATTTTPPLPASRPEESEEGTPAAQPYAAEDSLFVA